MIDYPENWYVKHTKDEKYWYEFFYEECVLCGSNNSYKVRRYTPKPEDESKRHHFSQYACGHHFC